MPCIYSRSLIFKLLSPILSFVVLCNPAEVRDVQVSEQRHVTVEISRAPPCMFLRGVKLLPLTRPGDGGLGRWGEGEGFTRVPYNCCMLTHTHNQLGSRLHEAKERCINSSANFQARCAHRHICAPPRQLIRKKSKCMTERERRVHLLS